MLTQILKQISKVLFSILWSMRVPIHVPTNPLIIINVMSLAYVAKANPEKAKRTILKLCAMTIEAAFVAMNCCFVLDMRCMIAPRTNPPPPPNILMNDTQAPRKGILKGILNFGFNLGIHVKKRANAPSKICKTLCDILKTSCAPRTAPRHAPKVKGKINPQLIYFLSINARLALLLV